jgi:hypothetical protein
MSRPDGMGEALTEPTTKFGRLIRALAKDAMSAIHHDLDDSEPEYVHEVQELERLFRLRFRRSPPSPSSSGEWEAGYRAGQEAAAKAALDEAAEYDAVFADLRTKPSTSAKHLDQLVTRSRAAMGVAERIRSLPTPPQASKEG